ncbi:MAG: glycosyltransferase [Kiritimatiellae bacterium]|nr:glycosyltransferase [Kiritimatiellia bacterium]
MKVVQIVKTLSEEYGGPARTVQGLVAGLDKCGVDAWLVALDECPPPWVQGVRNYLNLGSPSYIETIRLVEGLIHELRPDIIQLNDFWMPRLHACAVAARRNNVPYILTPHGTLDEWSLKQKWWKKYPALWTYQGYDMRHALAIHSTADNEIRQIRKFCGDTPVYYNTNGVIFPEKLPEWNRHGDGCRRAVFVSRIHKKKGLLNLVKAWAKVRPLGWKMEIVGTDADDYQKVVESAVCEYGLQGDFIFTGPLSDDKKWEAYRRSDLFILPTHTENFGIVVAEALYAGIPVITTKGAPWGDLLEKNCGWWTEISVDSIAEALKCATSMTDEQRDEMGERGRALVVEKYSWDSIAADLSKIYECLLTSKPLPTSARRLSVA